MPTFTTRQIEAFRALMERQTVTRAAEMLHVSQPAVSRLIADLEESAGFTLFDRHQGRLVPTAEAHAFHAEVERAFVGLDRLGQAAEQIRTLRRGFLRIAAAPALALDLLPEAVAAFLARHEGVDVALSAVLSSTVIDLVAGQRCEVGFVAEAIPHPGVQLEPLFERPMVCILPLGHALGARPVIRASDLAAEPFISLPSASDPRIAMDHVFAGAGVAPRVVVEALLSKTVVALVEHGAGISLVDPVNAYYARDRVLVRPFQPVILNSMHVATRQGLPFSLLAEAFVGLVRERLGAVLDAVHGHNIQA